MTLLGHRARIAPPPTPSRALRAPPPAQDTSMLARRTRLQPQGDAPRPTFAKLPPNPTDGQRDYIIDGSVVAAGNFGTAAAGGGANRLPVYWDNGTTTWRVG